MDNNLRVEEGNPSFYSDFFNEGLYVVAGPENAALEGSKMPAEMVGEPAHKPVLFSGDKMAETLILFNYPSGTAIPQADKMLLNQILSAVKLNFENIAWLNITQQEAFWERLHEGNNVTKIIAFGLEENMLPERIAEGKIHIYNGKKMLRAGRLADIALNKNQKKLLWEGLKELYGL